jgi:Tfp pilus assembly protein PilV
MKRAPTPRLTERGFSIIENLFAIALLGLTVLGTTNLHVYTLHANAANQDYSTLIDEVQSIIDGYRQEGLNSILARFGEVRTAIINGATTSQSIESVSPDVTYVVTFAAMSSASGSAPQAVRVRIEATHIRGKLGTRVFSYETIIAQTAS